MEAAIAARMEERKELAKQASEKLINNERFMDVQAGIAALREEVARLDTIIQQLNTGITPFIAKDGSKYSVRVFPVSQFGIGLDKLVGIIAGSASAFTDEMAMQYEAIVGIPFIELQMANSLLGTVDYVNKEGIYVEGSRAIAKEEATTEDDSPLAHLKAVKEWEKENVKDLYMALQSICIKLEMYEVLPTEEVLLAKLQAWEVSAERRAKKQLQEIEKSSTLNQSSQFTIED